MNKNQKTIRRIAAKNNGETYKVHAEYDKTTSSGKPTLTSFSKRFIPSVTQARVSKAPKVAASAESISKRVRSGSFE